jgi:TolA-binding protein
MKRLLAVAVAVTGFVAVGLAQKPDADNSRPDSQPGAPATQDGIQPPLAEPAPADADQLRQQYLKLMQDKAALMNAGELAAAAEQAAGDIRELQAARRLEQATTILAELIKAHPDTRAAQRAQRMLDREHDGGATPYYPSYPDSPSAFSFPSNDASRKRSGPQSGSVLFEAPKPSR